MGTFSDNMRAVALRLSKQLGNSCTITKVTQGQYDPLTGKTNEVIQTYPTYCVPLSKANEVFGLDGENTNLAGFDDTRVLVPYTIFKIDPTDLFNGQNIIDVSTTESQDNIIMYNLTVGEKE
jgi:hypothetical protein